jgi:hypothetical protein
MPDTLKERLRVTAADEKELLKQIEAAKIEVYGNTPVAEALVDYKTNYEQKWNDPEARLQIREVLRSIVDKITIDIENKSYKVFLKGATKPVSVQLLKGGFDIDGLTFPNGPVAVHSWKSDKGRQFRVDSWIKEGVSNLPPAPPNAPKVTPEALYPIREHV